MLTLGIVAAALIGVYFSNELADIEKTKIAEKIFAFKDMAWRRIFGCRCRRAFYSSSAVLWFRNRPAGCFGAAIKPRRWPR